MNVLDRRALLALVFAFAACGGSTSDAGAGGSGAAGSAGSAGSGGSAGSSGSAGSGGSAGKGGSSGAGAAGSGGTGGVDCSTEGCGAPPICGEGCQAPCGCCACEPGQVQNMGGTDYVCQGSCWALLTDGGAACSTDDDCAAGLFCRALQAGGSACTPFATEGSTCGGFVPAWWEERCGPGLICTDFPPFVADAPGTCRVPCSTDADCPSDRYCASNNDVCRDDGACLDDFDCDLPGNTYARPACVGYGECSSGTCSYHCGDGSCRDLAGVSFGFCLMQLGWAVVNGACASVSGCDARGYTFFPTESACTTSCAN